MQTDLKLNEKIKSPNHFMVDDFRRFLSTKSVPKKVMPVKPTLQIDVGPQLSEIGITSP